MSLPTASYTQLLGNISDKLHQGRQQAALSVNTLLVQTYWQIEQHIVEYEQQGHEKAEYGSGLLDKLSKDLSAQHGKGFSRSNIFYMRKFYSCFPNRETLSHKLTWSHYFEILKADKLHLPDKETLTARLNALLAQDRDDEVQE
jgi:hypothetical protein